LWVFPLIFLGAIYANPWSFTRRKDDLKLSDRHWTCAQCGASLDRDVNAAKNVLRWATSEVKPVDCSKSRAKQELNSMTKVS